MQIYNPYSLEGKTIFVTGASSGIGQCTAIECSKMGARVIINGRNEARLEETLSRLHGEGHVAIAGDISETETIDRIISQLGKIDGLVNCAGITKNVPFTFATPESLGEVMKVNFFAPAELSRLFVKKKLINKGGSIVFVASVSGVYCTAPGGSIYTASKAAVNGLVKGMAMDLAAKGIRVNAVCPGVIETHIFDSGVISSEQLEENKKQYPLKRFGKPEDVAYGIIYLLSDASSWVTGSDLLIDGGLLLQ